MRQKVEFIAAILFLMGLIVVSRNVSKYVNSADIENTTCTVVIDAGHGGKDPGKVGINDALEKDINLAIAVQVKELLEKENIEVIMTREEDVMMAKESATNKKIEDMKERVNIINKAAPKLVVSIHQNSYHQEEVSGAQVFYYSHSKEGAEAAALMQTALLSCNEENTRQAKANDTYYLLKRTEVPTIIVECGFLSNQKEAELLVSDDYQKKMAAAITDGIKQCVLK